MPNGRFHLRAGALFSRTAVILPRGDAGVEVDYGAGRVTWLGSTRYLPDRTRTRLTTASLNIVQRF